MGVEEHRRTKLSDPKGVLSLRQYRSVLVPACMSEFEILGTNKERIPSPQPPCLLLVHHDHLRSFLQLKPLVNLLLSVFRRQLSSTLDDVLRNDPTFLALGLGVFPDPVQTGVLDVRVQGAGRGFEKPRDGGES